jgi:hypothetical protein
MTRTDETAYYGIYVVEEDGHYWLTSDHGCEDYIGTGYPTDTQVDDYRDRVCVEVYGI